jgi:hypothetical protein
MMMKCLGGCRLMKTMSLVMFLRMFVSIQITLSLKSCSSSLSMRDDRMTRHVVFSKEVERIRVLLSRWFWKAEALMRIRKRLIERYPNTNFKSLRLNPISYKTICKCRGSIKHITNPRSNKGIIVMRDEHIKARTKWDGKWLVLNPLKYIC